MSGAARVYVTLDELAAMLELPEGHRLYAVDELPAGHCPGLALTIASDDDSPGHLPHYNASDPLMVMDLRHYRSWSATPMVTRAALRPVAIPPEDHQAERHNRPGRRADEPRPSPYIPAKPPIAASPATAWPKFPGEDLNYRGEFDRADPGDEDVHMGGPR